MIRTTLSVLLLSIGLFFSAHAQTQVDSLVRVGIRFHDQQLYDSAIATYQKALDIEPQSDLVHYELALSYMMNGDYDKAVIHCDSVIKQDSKHAMSAYSLKGSVLDDTGKTKESIEVLEEGIKRFKDNYILYYNLGINYFRLEEYEKAESAFVNALNNNFSHNSSHYMLGRLMNGSKRRVQSMLAFYMFLFLEPNTERSQEAYQTLWQHYQGSVEKQGNNTTINVDKNNAVGDFSAAELMISMMQAVKDEVGERDEKGKKKKKKNKPEEESSEASRFIDYTDTFFSVVGEMKDDEKVGIWWEYYVPFFYEIVQSDHFATYCHYIMQSSESESVSWLDDNPEKIEAFSKWLDE